MQLQTRPEVTEHGAEIFDASDHTVAFARPVGGTLEIPSPEEAAQAVANAKETVTALEIQKAQKGKPKGKADASADAPTAQ